MEKRGRSQAMVEFALVLPVLLAFLLALIDGAFLFQGYITVSHAAREAARFAVVYQPPQGECLHHDSLGNPILEPWPYCPRDYQEDPHEADDSYYTRRVELIKRTAVEATTGLRVQQICKTPDCIQNHYNEPGMLGVRVWGFQSFDGAEEEDKPGLPGLPVRVQVIHNVPLVIFGSFLPNSMVRVSSSSEMVNEGIQVGFGNQAPPTFSPPSNLEPPGTAVNTVTPVPSPTTGPSPTPTLVPVYHISLSPESAVNALPDEREHALTAYVTDDAGRSIAGARVTFLTDEGSFEYSGSGDKSAILTTGSDGKARAVIYANEPLTASIQAFLDYNSNGVADPFEPTDDASKVWETNGPYLVVSDYTPEPQAWIAVSVMDHPTNEAPFSLWWCPASITSTQVITRLAYPVDVNIEGNAEDIPVQVPLNVAGTYRIESHTGDGGSNGCADRGTLVAYSSILEIAEVPPDLVIDDVAFVDENAIAPGEPITLRVTVRNQAPVAVTSGPFDLDAYLDLGAPPSPQQLGEAKQWINNLGPLESTVITTIVTVYTAEDHELWFQADTTDYVNEGTAGGEDNNVYGPITIPLLDCIPIEGRSDDFETGLGVQWSTHNFGNADGSSTVSNGQLVIRSHGRSIWSGTNSYYFIYQMVEGDYDARLKIIQEPDTAQWAKVGLHIARTLLDSRTEFVMNMATHYRSPAAEQAAYRDSWGGTPRRTSNSSNQTIQLPSWLRIVREGNTYDFYRSDAADPEESDWIHQGSHTVSQEYPYVGIAHASYSTSYGTGIVDDFEICRPTGFTDVTPPTEEIHPPGLIQCSELIRLPGFEGNPTTVFSYWHGGDRNNLVGAYQRTSAEFYEGSFSMRLHASNSVIPCSQNQLQPFLYQDVQLPTEIYSQSTLVVSGYYLVTGSSFECSTPDTPDADDVLSLSLRELDGSTIVAPQNLLDGGTTAEQWHPISIDLRTFAPNLPDYAGQTLRLQWDATNDTDVEGTFFYIDQLSAQLCTSWPVPSEEAGTASFGGTITTRGENNVPTILPGTDVWAYAQGGDVLHTRSIQDGAYHFYNVPPGTYIIYAEAWVGGELRTVSTSVTVAADERKFDVNLLLQ